MRFTRASIAAIGYELAPVVVTSGELEARLAPLYHRLRLQEGQLEALTGIRERRWWKPGMTMAEGATRAGAKALEQAGIHGADVDMVIYGGVCRDNLEPATACAVANGLGVGRGAQVYDVSNACLGVMGGILQVATAIEAGQAEVGLVVACETARQIVELTIARMIEANDHDSYRRSLATLTGGSGAIGVVVSAAPGGHRILSGTLRNDVSHHELCRWGPDTGVPASAPMVMTTDAVGVMANGVKLGVETWESLIADEPWGAGGADKIICHQVGAANRDAILQAIGMPPERDFSTYEYLGNIGTVSLPITAAIAAERGFLNPGDSVAFAGIGSGLNCLMMALRW